MNRDTLDLLHAYFDEASEAFEGAPDATQTTTPVTGELDAMLATDPALADRFAEMALLERALVDRLAMELGQSSVERLTTRRVVRGPRAHGVRQAWASVSSRSAAAALLLLLLFAASTVLLPSPSASAAIARIEARVATGDRQYLVRVVEEAGSPPRIWPVDGALLSVRGHASYVLATLPEQGDGRIVGSDGVEAWTVPLQGPVRVSVDPSRFRGWLPGSQHGIPFLTDAIDADSLSQAYRIRFVTHDSRRALIVATRRPDARRGPRQVTIEYDPTSFEVLRMRLDGLPRARGGPESIELTLLSSAPLAADFFTHHVHHRADRHVIRDE